MHFVCRIFWNNFKLNLKNFLDAQIGENNKKVSSKARRYNNSQDNTNTAPTAQQLQYFQINLTKL